MSHPNARLTVHGRLLLAQRVESGWSVSAASHAAGVSRQTGGKWVARYRGLGEPGLLDVSSRPHHTRPRVPIRRYRRIIKARMLHKRGPHWLSWRLKVSRSTIYLVLRRFGINRLKQRSKEPCVRYEWAEPGDLIHLDVKKFGRIKPGGGHRAFGRGPGMHHAGAGWEFVHVAIDDHSRLAYAEFCADERAETTVEFLDRALEFFACAGVKTKRVLTDNGSNYRSRLFCGYLEDRDIKVIKTRPYHPQTNGKAEAFVKIITNEWAYGDTYLSNEKRAEMLDPFLRYYNLERPHGGIGGHPPISRVN